MRYGQDMRFWVRVSLKNRGGAFIGGDAFIEECTVYQVKILCAKICLTGYRPILDATHHNYLDHFMSWEKGFYEIMVLCFSILNGLYPPTPILKI